VSRPGAAVVGSGFGSRVHVPALRAAGFDVVALVGRDAERTSRRAARLDVPDASIDLDATLARPDVAAVTIATPPATHATIAVAASRAGKRVLCEKPFALDSTEAAAMLRAAEQAGVVHLVGHEFRFAPERAAIGRAIAEGRLGEVRVASFVQFVPLVADPAARVPRWWFDEDAGGGWLGASGSHVVDQVRAWLGEFDTVSAGLQVASDRRDVAEDTFTVRFRLRSGVEGVLQQTAAAWGPMSGLTRIVGTRGSAWIDGATAWIADADGSRPLDIPHDVQVPDPPAASDDPRHRFTHLELGPYTRLCEALLAGVEGHAFESRVPIPTFADGLAEMAVLDAIRASSAAAGATVAVADGSVLPAEPGG
jgi:predicted dehydrogenase